MTAEIVSFPALDGLSERPAPPQKFRCAGDVVEHCFRKIGVECSKELVRRFVEELEAVKHRMVPEWFLIETTNDPAWTDLELPK
jgi:hypothetical protein